MRTGLGNLILHLFASVVMSSGSLCLAQSNNVSYQKEWEERLAAATTELLPSAVVTNTRAFAGSSNLILRVNWVARTELLKYRDAIQAVLSGRNDGWNVRHPEGSYFLMTTGGVVWWGTLSIPSSSRTWVASLDVEHARVTYGAFVSELRKHALTLRIPDESIRVSIATHRVDGVTEDAFYLSDTTPIESILSDIKKNGKDERLNRNWSALMARPPQKSIQPEGMEAK